MLPDWASHISPLLTACGAIVLIWAALHDIAARTAPDWASVLLLAFGLILRAIDETLVIGAASAFAVFAVAAFFWRRGWLGGGDVKLMGATAMMLPPHMILSFITAMSIFGSALAVFYLIAGRIARSGERVKKVTPRNIPRRPGGLLARVARVELWRMRRGGPLPYACAIAAGFVIIIL